jgi:hypothetical protein
MAGRVAPASKVAGGHTLPFLNWQTMPFLKFSNAGCQVLICGLFCNKLFKKPNDPKFG